MPSPSYVPVIRTGVDVTFANVTVTTIGVSGTASLDGGANLGNTLRSTLGSATSTALAGLVTGDGFDRIRVRPDGRIDWGPGNVTRDTNLYRSGVGALTTDGFFAMGTGQSNGTFTVFGGQLVCGTAGVGLAVKEGANACQGVATLVAGTATVSTTVVAATSRIQISVQSLGTVTAPKAVAVTARTAGTSFTITSADPTDTSTVAWEIFQAA